MTEKSVFHSFWRAIIWLKIKNWWKIADTSFKKTETMISTERVRKVRKQAKISHEVYRKVAYSSFIRYRCNIRPQDKISDIKYYINIFPMAWRLVETCSSMFTSLYHHAALIYMALHITLNHTQNYAWNLFMQFKDKLALTKLTS